MGFTYTQDGLQVSADFISFNSSSQMHITEPLTLILFVNRYRVDAQLFESLRKKYGKDEIQAWIEYTKIKHDERKSREVENPEQFDDNREDTNVLRMNHDKDKSPGPGWEYSTVARKSGLKKYVGIWVSPTRKIEFRCEIFC